MQEKIIDLETKFSFQEDLLQDLNEEVLRQQRQIEALALQLELVKEQLADLLAHDGEPRADNPQEETPPHY